MDMMQLKMIHLQTRTLGNRSKSLQQHQALKNAKAMLQIHLQITTYWEKTEKTYLVIANK